MKTFKLDKLGPFLMGLAGSPGLTVNVSLLTYKLFTAFIVFEQTLPYEIFYSIHGFESCEGFHVYYLRFII